MKSTMFQQAVVNRSLAYLLASVVLDLYSSAVVLEVCATEAFFSVDIKEEIPQEVVDVIEQKMYSLLREGCKLESVEMMRENAVAFFEDRRLLVEAEKARSCPQNIVCLCRVGRHSFVCDKAFCNNLTKQHAFAVISCRREVFSYPYMDTAHVSRLTGVGADSKNQVKQLSKNNEKAKKISAFQVLEDAGFFLSKSTPSWQQLLWTDEGTFVLQKIEEIAFAHMKAFQADTVQTPSAHVDFYQNSFCQNLVDQNLFCQNKSGGIPNSTSVYLHKMYGLYEDEKSQKRVFEQDKTYLHAAFLEKKEPARFAEKVCCERLAPLRICDGLFLTTNQQSIQYTLFCEKKQLYNEIEAFCQHLLKMYQEFSLDLFAVMYIPKRLQKDADCKYAVEAAKEVLQAQGISLEIVTTVAALSGPRVEFFSYDRRRRAWPVTSLCFDQKAAKACGRGVLCLSGAWLFSFERVLALCTEKHDGWLPVSFAPKQVLILACKKQSVFWAKEVYKALQEANIRSELVQTKHLSKDIFSCSKRRVPFCVLIGPKEAEKKELCVRVLRERRTMHLGLDSFIAYFEEK